MKPQKASVRCRPKLAVQLVGDDPVDPAAVLGRGGCRRGTVAGSGCRRRCRPPVVAGRDELGNPLRLVLAVAVDGHQHVVAVAQGEVERRAQRRAVAAVRRMRDHLDARRRGQPARPSRRSNRRRPPAPRGCSARPAPAPPARAALRYRRAMRSGFVDSYPYSIAVIGPGKSQKRPPVRIAGRMAANWRMVGIFASERAIRSDCAGPSDTSPTPARTHFGGSQGGWQASSAGTWHSLADGLC